jgi:hypothetical protein
MAEREGFYNRRYLQVPVNPTVCDNTLCFSGLQRDSISGWSFYGFSHSLDFRVKRYHWYQ